ALGDHLQFVDIGARRTDDLGDLRQGADLVVDLDENARRESLTFSGRVPGQIDPAVGFTVEAFKGAREDRMDDNALARHSNADDTFARNSTGGEGEFKRLVAARAADRNAQFGLAVAHGRLLTMGC